MDINKGPTALHNYIDYWATENPEKLALIYEDGSSLNYKKLSELSSKASNYFIEKGIKIGDSIAIISFNSLEFAILFYAGLRVGAKVATIDPLTRAEDLRYQLEITKPKLIITDPEIYERDFEVFKDFGLKNILLTKAHRDLASFDEIIQKYNPLKTQPEINPEQDVALILHYAGIVGRTLEVYHTHAGLDLMIRSLNKILKADENMVQLIAIPLSHIFGFGALQGSLHVGATAIILRTWDVDLAIKLVNQFNVTHWPGPPMMFEALLQKNVKKEKLQSLKLCITGAAYVRPELQKAFFEDIGIPLIQVYGLTEAGLVAAQPPELKVYGSVGIPAPGVEVKIVDQETGTKELPIGHVGELIVRSPWIMKGYSDPDETSKAIRNGWLYTGDLFVMDENRLLYFKGVKKRMIKYKGYPIFPRDLEYILSKHPAIEAVFVTGMPDPEVGEKPIAYVVLKQEYKDKVSKDQLMEFVNSKIAFYKRIREIFIVDKIPEHH